MVLEHEKTLHEYRRTEAGRKSLLQQVQELEGQKLHVESTLAEMNKAFSMAAKKHSIEVDSF